MTRRRLVGWVKRNVLVLRGAEESWPTTSVMFGEWLELWRAGHRRGVLLRLWRFQVSACRAYIYVALTDHTTYIDIFFARPRGFFRETTRVREPISADDPATGVAP